MTSPDPVQPAWLPGNDVEAELVTALAADDREAFFRIIRNSRWYLPAFPEEPGGRRYLTHDLLGDTYVLVFTSARSLAGAVGALVDAYALTDYDEMAALWPDPAWRLAVNAGTPVDAWVTMAALAEAAAGERVVPTLARIAERSAPGDAGPQVDGVLDDFLAELNRAALVVPVAAGEARRPAVGADEEGPVVEVFTSEAAFAARHPGGGVAWVRARLDELTAAWPGEHCGLLIDPGSDLPVRIPGPAVAGLLLWGPAGAESPLPPPAGSEDHVSGLTSPEIADVEYIDGKDRRDGERGDSNGTSGLGESVFRRR